MIYTEEQKKTIQTHLENIKTHIETEILPRIPYSFEVETPDERFSIAINGPYAEKIRFCVRGYARTTTDLIFFNYAHEFLKNWEHLKQSFSDEIQKRNELETLLKNFKV